MKKIDKTKGDPRILAVLSSVIEQGLLIENETENNQAVKDFLEQVYIPAFKGEIILPDDIKKKLQNTIQYDRSGNIFKRLINFRENRQIKEYAEDAEKKGIGTIIKKPWLQRPAKETPELPGQREQASGSTTQESGEATSNRGQEQTFSERMQVPQETKNQITQIGKNAGEQRTIKRSFQR